MSIPRGLKSNKSIVPYINRANELETVNPVISYYCKIYVLDYILTNKLHTTDKEIEIFTINLLDETEAIKTSNDPENEPLRKILNDQTLSLGSMMEFTFKIFNSCLEDLQTYDGKNKIQLVSKFKACLNFLTVLSVFYDKDDSNIDYGKFTGGKVTNSDEFVKFISAKMKTLKFNLTQLLKDQVPIKQDKDLEDEFEQELKNLEQRTSNELAINNVENSNELTNDKDNETDDLISSAPSEIPNFIDDDKEQNNLGSENISLSNDENIHTDSKPTDSLSHLLEASGSLPDSLNEPLSNSNNNLTNNSDNEPSFSLPAAPKILPDEAHSNDLQLPGAPKFLPDGELSHINKNSSIQIFPPEKRESEKKEAASDQDLDIAPKQPVKLSASEGAPKNLTDIQGFLTKTECITKIQKHAKFAISALNYEDITTAEKELLAGLQLIQEAKEL